MALEEYAGEFTELIALIAELSKRCVAQVAELGEPE